jgi:hypothetical protein
MRSVFGALNPNNHAYSLERLSRDRLQKSILLDIWSNLSFKNLHQRQQTSIPLSGLVLNRLQHRSKGFDYYYHRSYYKTNEADFDTEEAPLRPSTRSLHG